MTTILYRIIIYIIGIFCFLLPIQAQITDQDLASMPDDTSKVAALYQLAFDYKAKDSVIATRYANAMMALSEKLEFTEGKAKAYYVLGRIAHEYNEHEDALRLFKQGITLYVETNDQRGIMVSYYWVARCYRRIANYPSYQKYLSLLEQQAGKLGDKEYLSYAYEGYGNLYRYIGDYPLSINYYMKSIDLSQELGRWKDVSGALNNMSLVYEYMGLLKEELKIQTLNCQILQKLGNESELVLCFSNLSNIYSDLGMKEKAKDYIEKALQIINKTGAENIPFKDLAAAYGQYADILVEEGDYTTGLEYYNKDLELKQHYKDVKGISDCYGNLAYVNELLGNNLLANEYLLKELAIATEIGYIKGEMKAFQSLAGLKAKQMDYSTAFRYQQEYMELKDKVDIESNSKQMDAWFQVKEQQQEIALLSKDKAMNEMNLKKRNTISLILGAGLFLIAFISILLLVSYNRLKKAEKKLQSINQELQYANKELESFSYSISHDLRAPLRAIDGFSKIIEENQRENLDPEGIRLFGMIQNNTKKMGNLINDLLAFSKVGKKELTKTRINMTRLFEEAMEELNKSINHHAKVNIQELESAKGDRALMNQVVFNLLSNAIKYSSKVKDPTVNISSEKNNHEIIYTIKDNGAGFDMRYAQKLFGVFQRLHSSDEFEGTGIGLAIVQRIVHKHGGKIWAEGEKSKGATFRFSLPAI